MENHGEAFRNHYSRDTLITATRAVAAGFADHGKQWVCPTWPMVAGFADHEKRWSAPLDRDIHFHLYS
jgi:hypothetical protein